MDNQKVYIAIMTTEDYYNSTSWDDVINLFNSKYPNNGLIIEKYFINLSPLQTINSITNFVNKYPSGNRAIISNYSSVVIVSSTYCKDNNLDILNISPGANSNAIKNLNNTLTYAPYNKYSVMSFFLTYIDYQMCEIKILYEPNTTSDSFYSTIKNEIIKQADLLNIRYTVSNLSAGQSDYGINPKSAIFILADPDTLKNIYVTPSFLKNIPPECYITLSESYYEDIFENIPAFVLLPSPINFTTTSQEVYDAIVNKKIIYYTIYSLYDILFVLKFFTTSSLSLNKNNYISVFPYNNSVLPAALYNNYLDSEINGAPYGKYDMIFTKNIIIGNDQELFLKYYRGGQSSLPNSYSIFKIAGITPNNESLIEYDEANYYKIYKKCKKCQKCVLMLVRYNSNITSFPPFDNLNNGNMLLTKFIYKYTSDEYFSTLNRLYSSDVPTLQVNPTMSKLPYKIKYFE